LSHARARAPAAYAQARLGRRGRLVGRGHRLLREAGKQLLERAVIAQPAEVADDERAASRRRPAARTEGNDAVACEGVADVLGRTQHGAPERVVTERRLVDQVLGHHRRLVVGARDLLDDDAALAVEFLGVDPGASDEVGEQVGGLAGALRARGDVKRDEIVAGVGVEYGADPGRGIVDIAVGLVLLAALEHKVLKEMSHPVLLGSLGPRTRVERHQDRDRARSLDFDPIEGKAVGEGRLLDFWHRC
jgi:hypothetical protein